MNQDAVINRLLAYGVITRLVTRGRYSVRGRAGSFRRNDILAIFATEVQPWRYQLRMDVIQAARRGQVAPEVNADMWQDPEPERPVLRTIHRDAYHTGGRSFVQEALNNIAPDEDGVKRSFGIEYEIYSLTAEQEDKLARLLDTLPKHVTERDGSLGDNGVEIVFAPVDAATYIRTVTTLANFVRENDVRMQGYGGSMAGMHTTYGVSNAEASIQDLQIRLNRMALAVKSVATQQKIIEVFGRDFGNYRELPGQSSDQNALLYNRHGNAFSTNGRPSNCWENRLVAWKCNPVKLVEFFKATEFAFHRAVQAQDFIKLFEVLGSNADGQ